MLNRKYDAMLKLGLKFCALFGLYYYTASSWIEFSLLIQNMIIGGIMGAFRNHNKYSVSMRGRSSNILNIYAKAYRSTLGKYQSWYARIDKPHGRVSYCHINVNPLITDAPDPHIQISRNTAYVAGLIGLVLSFVNLIASVGIFLPVIFKGIEVMKGLGGTKKFAAKSVVFNLLVTSVGGFGGAEAGDILGSMIFPGVGNMIGSIVGGTIMAGIGGHYVR